MIKSSDYVFEFVASLKVKHVFLLPGGGCMHLVDSLGRSKKLEPVCFLHEQGAAIAADAYSQYTNNIGVALVTTGPGGTNAMTAIAASWIDSIPVLVVSGQVKRADMIGTSGVRQVGGQEVDIVSMVKPVTKYAVTVMEPKDIRYHLEKAVYLAHSGRPGPVWIDVPLDVQGAPIDEKVLRGFDPSELSGSAPTDPSSKVNDIIQLLNASKRPVILAGNGIRLAKAEKQFLQLVEELKVPVLTTWKSIDFLPEDHKYYFGRPGSIASRGANFIQQNSDFIIVIGARMDLAQVGYNYDGFARNAKKVVVDIDPAEIKKMISRNMKIDIPVVADAKLFISEMIKAGDRIKTVDRSKWMKRCLDWKERYPVVTAEHWKPKVLVNTYALIDVLSQLLTKDDVIVPGSSGSCSEIFMQAFKVKKGQRIFNDPGLGSMGFGLPASIGGAVASGKRTITIIGDGGLQHNIQELQTMKRLNLPVKVFVLNNNGYASIRITQNKFFNGRLVCCDPSSGLTLPDTCKVAASYGLKTEKIFGNKDLRTKVKKVLASKGPVVCEVMVDPSLQTLPKLESMVRPDGSIVSKPLEDLFPFLDRDEFKKNMIIPL